MFCNSIEEYSLLYLENELSSKKKEQLTKHIKTCDKCRLMFNLIKFNYHAEEKVAAGNSMLPEKINALTDKSLYPIPGASSKSFSMKKVILVSFVLTLFVFATANAKTIYKSSKELINSMFLDRNLFNISGTVHTGAYSDESYVKSVYEKYRTEIETFVSRMKTAEISSLKINEGGKKFKVQIAKGIKGDLISYGFEGYTVYYNDFFNNYFMNMAESVLNNRTEYSSIDELLGAVGISPILRYTPDGYKLTNSYWLGGSGKNTIPDSIGLVYRNSKDESLSIALTRSKMAVSNEGVPEELKASAGIPESSLKSKPSSVSRPDNTGNAAPSSVNRETLVTGGYQTVYTEENLPAKDGTSETFRAVSIFLGDGAKLPILRIESAYLDKQTLIKVAENIEIANLDKNQIQAADYFKGVKDEKILAYTGKYLDNIKAGKTEFKFKIDKDTEFYKTNYNDTYYILYRNIGIDKLKSFVQLPINLNKDLLNKFSNANVQILGWPYTAQKAYSISFMIKNSVSVVMHTDRMIRLTGDLELTDHIIAKTSCTQQEVKPLFSSSGHLYYLIDTGKKSWLLQTMYEENGMACNYNFNIDKEIMADEKAIIDFINSL